MSNNLVIDMDGVLVDWVLGFTRVLLAVQGRDIRLAYSTGAQQTWRFEDSGFDTPTVDKAWELIKASPTFWQDLPTLLTEHERDEVRRLIRTFDVKFVTSRPGINTKQQTEAWLHACGLDGGTVVVAENKLPLLMALQPVAILEDKPSTIREARKAGLPVCVRDWPYNRSLGTEDYTQRVSSITEFAHLVAPSLAPQAAPYTPQVPQVEGAIGGTANVHAY